VAIEILSDESDFAALRAVAQRRIHAMPRLKPKAYYWSHPWPQRARRALYGAWAALMAMGWFGTSAIQGSDRVAPVLFALGCAWCAVGVVRVESWVIWAVSGVAVFTSYLGRLVQVFVLELGWTDQEPPDSSAMAASAYIGLCIGSVACWRHWLHPRVERG
jgi:hypothetical protein